MFLVCPTYSSLCKTANGDFFDFLITMPFFFPFFHKYQISRVYNNQLSCPHFCPSELWILQSVQGPFGCFSIRKTFQNPCICFLSFQNSHGKKQEKTFSCFKRCKYLNKPLNLEQNDSKDIFCLIAKHLLKN